MCESSAWCGQIGVAEIISKGRNCQQGADVPTRNCSVGGLSESSSCGDGRSRFLGQKINVEDSLEKRRRTPDLERRTQGVDPGASRVAPGLVVK